MKKSILKKQIFTIVLDIFVLLLLLAYNHKRIMGIYRFGFHGKPYSVNLIPIYELRNSDIRFLLRYLIKIVFFGFIGMIVESVLYLHKRNFCYFYVMFGISLFMELLAIFTSGWFIIPLDIDTWISYFIGIVLGFFVWNILKKVLRRRIR